MPVVRTVIVGLGMICLLSFAPRLPAQDTPIRLTAAGQRLAESIDVLDVEHHWEAGRHIADWKTGEPDDKTGGPRSHCSLFVAAVCRKLHAPMLDPPPQTFLSNRQQDWLRTEGPARGWKPVSDPVAAQELANHGTLVVASFKNPDPKKAGHIAVVRPASITAAEVKRDGPRLSQAGTRNYRETTTRTGFRNHPGAWDKGEVRFFAYPPAKQ